MYVSLKKAFHICSSRYFFLGRGPCWEDTAPPGDDQNQLEILEMVRQDQRRLFHRITQEEQGRGQMVAMKL